MSEVRWCRICCTRHDLGPDCPGELVATGSERYGWKATVQTSTRQEISGVLIAPSGPYWRARIVTFPKMLWSVPGERRTMKFVARSPQAVETLARDYIRKLCEARGFKLSEEPAKVEAGEIPPDEADRPDPGRARNVRYLHVVDVRFGEDKPTERASTADLSARGMFVVTKKPLPAGRWLRLVLEVVVEVGNTLNHRTIQLTGRVTWARPKAEGNRPAGMGVQLPNPPAIYVDYVRSLKAPKTATEV